MTQHFLLVGDSKKKTLDAWTTLMQKVVPSVDWHYFAGRACFFVRIKYDEHDPEHMVFEDLCAARERAIDMTFRLGIPTESGCWSWLTPGGRLLERAIPPYKVGDSFADSAVQCVLRATERGWFGWDSKLNDMEE